MPTHAPFPIVSLDAEVRKALPALRLACLFGPVLVKDSPAALIEDLDTAAAEAAARLDPAGIRALPHVAASRDAYKAFGVDPSRYRPSAEALLRRAVSGKGLYRISNAVDLLNSVSIRTGYSIGGYDANRIQGVVRLGNGQPDEPYEAIGRGTLNITGLPVLRDELGAFGTPTSDSVRTCVQTETRRFLMVFFDFGGKPLSASVSNSRMSNSMRSGTSISPDPGIKQGTTNPGESFAAGAGSAGSLEYALDLAQAAWRRFALPPIPEADPEAGAIERFIVD